MYDAKAKCRLSPFNSMLFLSVARCYGQIIKHTVAVHLICLCMVTWRPVCIKKI